MGAIVIRSPVQVRPTYGAYREELRYDFWFACAYCTMSEVEALGVGFEIDHFIPQTLRPSIANAYGNLMWSCKECNGKKLALFPGPVARKRGYRYVRPDRDDPRDHYELDGVKLKKKTLAGDWTIRVLLLNSQMRLRLRNLRLRAQKSEEEILGGLQALAAVRIDQLSRQNRARFLGLRRALASEGGEAAKSIGDLIRAHNRSPFLDPDPTKAQQLTERRKFLKEVGAIVP